MPCPLSAAHDLDGVVEALAGHEAQHHGAQRGIVQSKVGQTLLVGQGQQQTVRHLFRSRRSTQVNT